MVRNHQPDINFPEVEQLCIIKGIHIPCPSWKFHQLTLGNLSSLDQWQIPWKPQGPWLKNVRFPENWPDLVNKQKAIENGQRNSELSHYKWWFSHQFFVCLPEGIWKKNKHAVQTWKSVRITFNKAHDDGIFSAKSICSHVFNAELSSVGTKELQFSVAPRDMDKAWRGAEPPK